MTTLIAISTGKGSVIASDMQSTSGNRINPLQPKWLEINDGFWVASTGFIRTKQLLCKKVNARECRDIHTAEDFVDALSRWLPEWMSAPRNSNEHPGPDKWDVCFLTATAKAVARIDCDLCITEAPRGKPVTAGSGEAWALGAANALLSTTSKPGIHELGEIAKQSIRVASSLDVYSSGLWFQEIGT